MPVGTPQAPGTCAQASRMTAVAEADFGKGLLPHPEGKKGVIHYTCIAKPFFLFSPSSLRVVVSKLPHAHSQGHEPLSQKWGQSQRAQAKNVPGMVQPCWSLQASPVHEATILFMGTHGT